MKKIWNAIARDLWIVLLDMIAVNAAFYLTILIRFYANWEYRPIVGTLIGQWIQFTPYYTVLCIVVFAAFRLYRGMWRLAGISDMNRIILANVCTAVIQVVGTLLFVARMPITYYALGIVLQFVFILAIRFGYRLLLAEKKMISIRKQPSVPVMIIGTGETARNALIHLENTLFKVIVAIDDKNAGTILNSVPVEANYKMFLPAVKLVLIADRTLSEEKREEIQENCKNAGVEVQDYSGLFSNLGGRVPLSSLLSLITGPVSILSEGQEQRYENGNEALKTLKDRYEVENIEDAKIYIKKSSSVAYAGYDAWAKQHKEETGEDVSFF